MDKSCQKGKFEALTFDQFSVSYFLLQHFRQKVVLKTFFWKSKVSTKLFSMLIAALREHYTVTSFERNGQQIFKRIYDSVMNILQRYDWSISEYQFDQALIGSNQGNATVLSYFFQSLIMDFVYASEYKHLQG